jgi:hypothetical protein
MTHRVRSLVSSLRDSHLAVVPLPRVSDAFADGELLGVGLLLPRVLTLIGTLGRGEASKPRLDRKPRGGNTIRAGDVVKVVRGPFGVCRVAIAQSTRPHGAEA